MRVQRNATSSAVTIVVNASLAALTAAACSGALAQAPRSAPLACADMKSAGIPKTVVAVAAPLLQQRAPGERGQPLARGLQERAPGPARPSQLREELSQARGIPQREIRRVVEEMHVRDHVLDRPRLELRHER